MNGERPVVFDCRGERLVGILHEGSSDAELGVVVVVGGPQYRVGSHRQFVVMARGLAAAGIPVLRFDCRGMGDSEGVFDSFEHLDTDIRVAVDCFRSALPRVRKLALFGLCDAASAALMYVSRAEGVHGLILMNPWVRTETSEAKAYLRDYYVGRVMQKSFWRKVFTGRVSVRSSIGDFMRSLHRASKRTNTDSGEAQDQGRAGFIGKMRAGLESFAGPVLLMLSGRDLTAREFEHLMQHDPGWRSAFDRTGREVRRLPDADHTLSSREDLAGAVDVCVRWLWSNRDLRE